MDHYEVCEQLKLWFRLQMQYKGWFLFQNNTGYASVEHVKYGMPSCGGGSDFLAFGCGQTEFFEVKTVKSPTLNKKQKTFIKNMVGQGFKCWVFKEMEQEPYFYIVPAEKYRPFKKWVY